MATTLTEKKGTLESQTYKGVEIGNDKIVLKGDETVSGGKVTRFKGEVHTTATDVSNTRIGSFDFSDPGNNAAVMTDPANNRDAISVNIDNKQYGTSTDAILVLLAAIDQFNAEMEE